MRGKPFEPGNKLGRGRPRGSRNKANREVKELLENFGPAVARKCIALALAGDKKAIQMVMDRIAPARRDAPVQFKKLPINTIEDLNKASKRVVSEVFSGQLAPSDALQIGQLIEGQRQMIEYQDFERRLRAVEERQ